MAEIPVNASDRVVIVDVVSNGQTLFDFDFLVTNGPDLKAILHRASGDVPLQFGVDFTASGLNDPDGGSITLVGIDTVDGETLTIYSDIVIERPNDYTRDLFAAQVNIEMDRVFQIMQEIDRDLARSMKVALGLSGPAIVAGPAGSVPVYDALGNFSTSITATEIANAQVMASFARQWAVSLDTVNDGTNPVDYSAKHYAGVAANLIALAQEAIEDAVAFLSGEVKIVYFPEGATNIALPTNPGSVNNVTLFMGGLPQSPLTYSKTGTGPYFITLSEPALAPGWLSYGNAVTVNTPAAGSVGVEQAAPNLWLDLAPAGAVIQSVYAGPTSAIVCTGTAFGDNSLPQSTEGSPALELSITPLLATSKIRVRYGGYFGANGALHAIFAAFVNAATSASAAQGVSLAASGETACFGGEFEFSPGSTSPQTIKIRAGTTSGAVIVIGGNGTTGWFDGSPHMTLVIEEIKG